MPAAWEKTRATVGALPPNRARRLILHATEYATALPLAEDFSVRNLALRLQGRPVPEHGLHADNPIRESASPIA
jgi:hypothetical protein